MWHKKKNKWERSKKCRFLKMCLNVKEYLFKTVDIPIGQHVWILCVSHSVMPDSLQPHEL